MSYGYLLVVSYGVVAVVLHGFPSKWTPRWKLFRCPLCLGFWSGLAVHYTARSELDVLFGLASAGVCHAVERFLRPILGGGEE